jgi:hypothetical protein
MNRYCYLFSITGVDKLCCFAGYPQFFHKSNITIRKQTSASIGLQGKEECDLVNLSSVMPSRKIP